MSENAIDSENSSKPAAGALPTKVARKPAKKAKPAKKPSRAKKTAAKPKANGTNKKAEVIAMMKRAKGATLTEIMKATGWQAHTVRGFVSILGSKGEEKIELSKNAAGNGRTRSEDNVGQVVVQTLGQAPGAAFLLQARISDVRDPSRRRIFRAFWAPNHRRPEMFRSQRGPECRFLVRVVPSVPSRAARHVSVPSAGIEQVPTIVCSLRCRDV